MPNLFVDTAGWGNLIDATQPYHSLAAIHYRSARQQQRKLITTNYVIAELITLLISPLRMPRSIAIEFIEELKSATHIQIVHINAGLDRQAWEMFKRHQDKEWSLTDCVSFVLMKEQNIVEALTSDHHFEQAGFVRLLK
ncbi:MAG: type II toxin-antitoxin system VapC family toxin [Chloroflexi bacterium]|nr:type II toxin-antitoxin system VapC family toxin [Chloroflexota bacterium]